MMQPAILIVEDDNKLRGLLSRIIAGVGYQVFQAASAHQGLAILEAETITVVVTDVRLPDGNGIELVKAIKQAYPHIEVINLTSYGTIKDSVSAMRNGAFDYMIKGDDNDQIIPIINKAVEKAILQFKLQQPDKKERRVCGFQKILGVSPAIVRARQLAERMANTCTTVLLLGETGTGKEVFAQAIHNESDRKNKPFVAVNCSSFSNQLLSSELFGHTAGAFTGALKDKKGLFEEADGGTLFLDEIGEMNLELQAKMLRVLETGTFNRVGDSETTKVNTRIIAATNKDLKHDVEQHLFRADLFYRLAVFTISLPPLRERREDIQLLALYFASELGHRHHKRALKVDDSLMQALVHHQWKGNIRELKNVIERLVILANGDTLTSDSLPFDFINHADDYALPTLDLASIEGQFIRKALHQTQGNKTEAARLLGIGLSTLYRKIEEYKL